MSEKASPCLFVVDAIDNIIANFLNKQFIQEKKPSKGAAACFVYSLGTIKRLHIRVFEEVRGKYLIYAHTEPKPLADPLFHLKGAVAGSVKAQKAINVLVGVSKVAAGILEHWKPKKETEDEELSEEEQKKLENIETFQKVSNSLPYMPEEKKELADYDEGCRILKSFFPEYDK